jgi:hypothetical protein
MTITANPDTILSSIHWVHQHHAKGMPKLSAVVNCLDYCAECVDIVVAELQQQQPRWAENIMADGGWDPYRYCDSPPECDRCGEPLSFSLIDCRGNVVASCCDTLTAWQVADNVFCKGVTP